ncbi:terpene synthase family protein [Chryseobacterium ginsenosidimutans]|uniref:terpene synthase family protein n=1 Tax=Chryseobacterium ginsenosidimutans TaxID=687846 RepID=UPI0027B93736|nr:terpene synthase family protein [Chryseobacterium ginsenosidimutans]
MGKFKTREAADHTIGCDLIYWTAVCFPLTDDLEKFRNINKYFQLYCICDDHADEPWGDVNETIGGTQKHWKRTIKLLETLRDETPWQKKLLRNIAMLVSAKSYQRAAFNYMNKILQTQTPSFRERYINRFKEYLENVSIQINFQKEENHLNIEKYKEYRINSLASIPCTLMIEYLYDAQLTSEEYYHPALQMLEKVATWQSALTNDLFSLYKECKEGILDNVNNIISILVFNGMSIQEAVDETCSQIETANNDFIKIRDEWFESGEEISNAVKAFISGIEYYMAGSAYWHRQSKRYHGKNWDGVISTGYLEWSSEGTIYQKQ